MGNKAVAGNHGEGIRSDCRISMEIKDSGGIRLEIRSKLNSLYGSHIRELIRTILKSYGIAHAEILLEDSGALDLVIAARMEAVIRKCTGKQESYMLTVIEENKFAGPRERRRCSRLYLPGNIPKMMINAGIHSPDGIILDLEDSVAPGRKEEARILIRNALCQVDFYGAERMVRINQLPAGIDDLAFIVPFPVELILIPKCENPDQVSRVNAEINSILDKEKEPREIFLMPILESALGIENAYRIAVAADNIVGIAIGLEDLTADLGVQRTREGSESLYARTRLVNACRAAGILAIDSVYSDVADNQGLLDAVKESKSLGFNGMGCIHPRQIRIIHEGYQPSAAEIEKALQIAKVYEKALADGKGVISLGSKMIDAPVVKRALRTVREAKEAGILNTDKDNQDE